MRAYKVALMGVMSCSYSSTVHFQLDMFPPSYYTLIEVAVYFPMDRSQERIVERP